MFIKPEQIRVMEQSYGIPQLLRLRQEIGMEEMTILQSSQHHGRAHDITMFIFNHQGEVAVIHKPIHDPGVYRAPSGGLQPDEDFEKGALREAWEETGLEIALERYLLRVEVDFTADNQLVPWTSHVFTARILSGELDPQDRVEIESARYATPAEIQGPIRQALVASSKGLLFYRIALTDAVATLLGWDY